MDWPVTERYDELIHLRGEFWFFSDLATRIRASITDLESSDSTKDTIHAHKGSTILASAEALIAKGKTAKGRTLLRKVRREFEGTPAAKKATALLEK